MRRIPHPFGLSSPWLCSLIRHRTSNRILVLDVTGILWLIVHFWLVRKVKCLLDNAPFGVLLMLSWNWQDQVRALRYFQRVWQEKFKWRLQKIMTILSVFHRWIFYKNTSNKIGSEECLVMTLRGAMRVNLVSLYLGTKIRQSWFWSVNYSDIIKQTFLKKHFFRTVNLKWWKSSSI